MKRLNVGIIGLGRAGMMHLKNILNLNEVNVVAVSDEFLDDKIDILKSFGIKNIFKNYCDLLALEKIDTVFIFTSTNTHEKIVTDAAKFKKNIFCEKPLSMSMKESDSVKVLQAVRDNNVKLGIGFNRRFDNQFSKMHKKIDSGEIGSPYLVKITSRDPDLLPHDLILRIGGLIFDFTMHDFDMARYLMRKNITEVYAKGNTLIDPTLKDIDDVDTVVVLLEFEDGTYGVIDNSRKAVYGYDQRIEVFGSKGMIKAENVTNSSVEIFTKENTTKDNPLSIFNERYKESYINEVKDFVNSILNNTEFNSSGTDAIMAQRVASATIKSLKTGKPVKVDNHIPAFY